ncbi:MAG: hypothetical protein GXY76_22700 [Chloroflexi bacterium]|nr:hypothetical protein [Chloroflexota bacterium]
MSDGDRGGVGSVPGGCLSSPLPDPGAAKQPSLEEETLRDLQSQGLAEIERASIGDLLALAAQARQARLELERAEAAFRERDLQPDGIEEVLRRAESARSALQALSYPDGEFFDPRRRALQGLVARADALLDALDLSRWVSFAEELPKLWQAVSNSGGRGEAEGFLEEAKGSLVGWLPETSPRLAQARAALARLEDELGRQEAARSKSAVVQARAWTGWAQEALQNDPFVALRCLAEAEALLGEFGPPAATNESRGSLDPRTESGAAAPEKSDAVALRRDIDEIKERVLDGEARQWLLQKGRARVDREVKEPLAAHLMDWTKGDHSWLSDNSEGARTVRRRVDELIGYLVIDPEYLDSETDDPQALLGAIEQRRAAKYLANLTFNQADDLRSGSEGQEPGNIYRRLRLLQEALRHDPDYRDAQDCAAEAERMWSEIEQQLQQDSDKLAQQAQSVQNLLKRLGSESDQSGGADWSSMDEIWDQASNEEAALRPLMAVGEGWMEKGLADASIPPPGGQELQDRLAHAQGLSRHLGRVRYLQERWNGLRHALTSPKCALDAKLVFWAEWFMQKGALAESVRAAAKAELEDLAKKALEANQSVDLEAAQQAKLTEMAILVRAASSANPSGSKQP